MTNLVEVVLLEESAEDRTALGGAEEAEALAESARRHAPGTPPPSSLLRPLRMDVGTRAFDNGVEMGFVNVHDIVLADVGRIDWIEARDRCVALPVGAKTSLATAPVSRLAAQLDPRESVRIQRSTIVHLDAVEALENSPDGDPAVILTNGTRRRISLGGMVRPRLVLEILR